MKRTLKEWRAHHDLKMADVADYLGIHYVTYSKLEKNPELITIRQALLLAELFECETDEIIFFRVKPNFKLDKCVAI